MTVSIDLRWPDITVTAPLDGPGWVGAFDGERLVALTPLAVEGGERVGHLFLPVTVDPARVQLAVGDTPGDLEAVMSPVTA